jgi:membrane-associated phospholipid phosphatase
MPPYYLLQHYVFYPVTVMPPGPVDHWIPFNEHTVWLYLSLFLLQPIAPMHMVRASELCRYALGGAAMSGIADVVFFFWPTAIMRPEVAGTNAIYQHLTALVTPLNACPSLHAAMAVYSALCGEQLWRGTRRAWRWRSGIWLWALGIIYATLSTKEHVFTDAVAGSMLGLVIYLVAFGNARMVTKRPGRWCILARRLAAKAQP